MEQVIYAIVRRIGGRDVPMVYPTKFGAERSLKEARAGKTPYWRDEKQKNPGFFEDLSDAYVVVLEEIKVWDYATKTRLLSKWTRDRQMLLDAITAHNKGGIDEKRIGFKQPTKAAEAPRKKKDIEASIQQDDEDQTPSPLFIHDYEAGTTTIEHPDGQVEVHPLPTSKPNIDDINYLLGQADFTPNKPSKPAGDTSPSRAQKTAPKPAKSPTEPIQKLDPDDEWMLTYDWRENPNGYGDFITDDVKRVQRQHSQKNKQ